MGAGIVKKRLANNSGLTLAKDNAQSIYLANQGDKEAQFRLGKAYLKQFDYQNAERWLRYAAIQGHYKAYRSLILGARHNYFLSTPSRIQALAIEILKALVTPNPSQTQTDELVTVITHHLNTEFNLMQPHYQKE